MVNLDSSKAEFEKTITHLRSEFGSLRGTRATSALVEHVMVEVYGSKQALKALASIAVADAKTLTIEPWDKSSQKKSNGRFSRLTSVLIRLMKGKFFESCCRRLRKSRAKS